MTSAVQDVETIPEWTLGWRLQRALAHAGISAEEMGRELGVTRATISRWMHDRGGAPRLIYVKQWALRTGVPLAWLQDGVVPDADAPTPPPRSAANAGKPSCYSNTAHLRLPSPARPTVRAAA